MRRLQPHLRLSPLAVAEPSGGTVGPGRPGGRRVRLRLQRQSPVPPVPPAAELLPGPPAPESGSPDAVVGVPGLDHELHGLPDPDFRRQLSPSASAPHHEPGDRRMASLPEDADPLLLFPLGNRLRTAADPGAVDLSADPALPANREDPPRDAEVRAPLSIPAHRRLPR